MTPRRTYGVTHLVPREHEVTRAPQPGQEIAAEQRSDER